MRFLKKKLNRSKRLKPVSGRAVKKYRLKKKYRYWRSFKYFFLYRKRIKFFTKLKWLFNNRRIFKHQIIYLYGFSIYKICFAENSVYGFNTSFSKFLMRMEAKLIVLLLRSKFCLTLLDSFLSISKKRVAVNGNIQLKTLKELFHKDLLQKKIVFWNLRTRHRIYIWRRFRWKTVRYRLKRQGARFFQRYLGFYRFTKNSTFVNYMSVNYKILSGILVRYPLYSEILLNTNPIILRKRNFRQLYFLY